MFLVKVVNSKGECLGKYYSLALKHCWAVLKKWFGVRRGSHLSLILVEVEEIKSAYQLPLNCTPLWRNRTVRR